MASYSVDGGLVSLSLPREAASTAQAMIGTGATEINTTAAQSFSLAAPVAGAVKIITKSTSSSASQTVSSTAAGTSATFGATGVTLTFSAVDQAVVLYALSATRWEIVSNVGTVVVS